MIIQFKSLNNKAKAFILTLFAFTFPIFILSMEHLIFSYFSVIGLLISNVTILVTIFFV
jgi:hypothetical protein